MAQETELRLKKINFTKSLRGYSCEEVDTYLAYVYDRFAEAARQSTELRRKMNAMAATQNEFREEAQREQAQAAALSQKLAAEIRAKQRELASLEEQRNTLESALQEEARRQAAKLLANAEAAAASILQKAEAEARQITAQATQEAQNILADSNRILAEKNNTADRMVQEIDSFREKVFALYGQHIESLERISQITNAFYETQSAYAQDEDVSAYAAADTMDESAAALYEEPAATITDAAEDTTEAAEETPVQDSSELSDTYWQSPSAAYTEEEEYAYEEPDTDLSPASSPEEPEAILSLSQLMRDSWEESDADMEELSEAYAVSLPEEEDFSVETDPMAAMDFAPQAETDFATEEEDKSEQMPSWEDTSAIMDDDDLLSALAGKYLTAAAYDNDTDFHTPDDTPRSLDDLFSDGHEMSLTGEFNRIYDKNKTAASIEVIRKQPLVAPQKPDKKHGKK